MEFHGFQKLTLLDFPGKTACTLFTGGCDLRCPFCHNADLVLHPEAAPTVGEAEILAYLERRRGVLDGVAITGGEPLLHPELAPFLRQVRGMGFAVKLDTNGTYPLRLRTLVEEGLLDYVAMDVKASPAAYPAVVGIPNYNTERIAESIRFLLTDAVDYEFRTTVVREFHDLAGMEALGQWIRGAKRHYLQAFKDSGALIGAGLSPVPKSEMLQMREIMLQYVQACEVRGV